MSSPPLGDIGSLLHEVRSQFEQQLSIESLLVLSNKVQAEFREHLISSPQCMLPSFNYSLPTGQEQGKYLALEVGGSTLRMALLELCGRDAGIQPMQLRTIPIENSVRQLPQYEFFDWMAEHIGTALYEDSRHTVHMPDTEPLRMGVAWAFPIAQTSIRSGNVLGMGKGFLCSEAIKGQDLGDIIQQACQRAKLNVRLEAIVNDSCATLLARAYLDSATRLAVILGTGMNAAVHLPINSLDVSKSKFPWLETATHVLINTELSMFGKDILPRTRWDKLLNANHILPDYQPFEYLVSGGYMGEIVRLVLVEAVETAGLHRGLLPPKLKSTPYALDTKTLADIEAGDISERLSPRLPTDVFYQRPTFDIPESVYTNFLQPVIRSVSSRSIAFFATGIHALSSLLQDIDQEAGLEAGLEDQTDHISIGCDGSVINKYPRYMERVQDTLDRMIESEAIRRKKIALSKTQDGAVLGAGIAAALATSESLSP